MICDVHFGTGGLFDWGRSKIQFYYVPNLKKQVVFVHQHGYNDNCIIM